MGVPKRKESISGPHDRGVTPTEDGGRSNSRALNIVLSQGKGEGSTGSYVAPEASMSNERIGSKSYKDGEVESGGEVNGQRRRATTRPSAGASQVGATETRGEMPANHERERSRKSSAKQPRSAIKITEPLLPSAKGVSRAPASAMYFSLLPSHGRPPAQALRAHTGTLVGDRIWFLGGVDGRMCWRSVAWLDTESLLWSTVDTNGEQLPPLRAHTTTLVGELLYIFGGGDGPTYSNDVWIFNTGEHPIVISILIIVTHRFTRATIATPRSSLPPPRRAHTTVVYRNFLVVFGGGNGQAALNDVWALDVSDPDRLTWHEWRTKGDVPQKKGYHTANLIGDKMIVFGGSDGHASFADVHVLNLRK